MAVARAPRLRVVGDPYTDLLARVRRTSRQYPGCDAELLADLEAGCRVVVHGYRTGLPCFFAVVDRTEGAWPASPDEWPAADRLALYPATTTGRK